MFFLYISKNKIQIKDLCSFVMRILVQAAFVLRTVATNINRLFLTIDGGEKVSLSKQSEAMIRVFLSSHVWWP